MKYVRTEDGIIYVGDLIKDENGDYCNTKDCIELQGKYVLKESDHIDDLCDEFVLFDNENKIHYKSKEGEIWWLGAALYTESVRGAIFTNEGMKYVAKLNKNNDLELI